MRLPVLIKERSMQPYTPILIYIIYSWIPVSRISKRHLHAEAALQKQSQSLEDTLISQTMIMAKCLL